MGKKGTNRSRRMNPRYFEDYDKNDDGQLNVQDIVAWGKDGRQDIQQRLSRMIGSGNLPKKRPVRRAKVRKVYGVPRTRWLKMNPRARRAQVQRFQRSRRAQVQRVRRKNRMIRGAVKLQGEMPTPRERGRLGRTQRRQHAMLERRRRRWRIRRLGRGK
tara:strand:- start:233 stop:709 length:477 start_codon:yes stop_codon:yes gene_type:complete